MSANKRASWCDVKNEINILKQAFRYLEIHAYCNFEPVFNDAILCNKKNKKTFIIALFLKLTAS